MRYYRCGSTATAFCSQLLCVPCSFPMRHAHSFVWSALPPYFFAHCAYSNVYAEAKSKLSFTTALCLIYCGWLVTCELNCGTGTVFNGTD